MKILSLVGYRYGLVLAVVPVRQWHRVTPLKRRLHCEGYCTEWRILKQLKENRQLKNTAEAECKKS